MKTSDVGIRKLKQWEGLRLDAYTDSAGVWTIGYGHTGTARPGMTITEEEAERLLRQDVSWAEDAVSEAVKVPLSQHQFDALVSFVYNVGAGAFRKSTLLKRLNAGQYDDVPAQLSRWVYAGGKRLQGLANRRAAEAGLWAKGEHVASRGVTASDPPKSKPVLKPETIATAGTAAGGVIAALSQASGPIGYALAAVVGVAGIAAVALIFRRYWGDGA